MSPTVNNFVHDLVAMAKAMEDLPVVTQQLEDTQADLELSRQKVQSREVHILNLKQELEAAQATIRSLEVARDDAELRFLEADDRTMRAVEFIKAQFGAAGSLIQALEPPKPMPEPVPEVVHSISEVQSAVDPTPSDVASPPTQTDSAQTVDYGTSGSAAQMGSVPQPEPVSVPSDPTPAQAAPTGTGTESAVSSSDPEPSQRWSSEWYDWRDRQVKAAE